MMTGILEKVEEETSGHKRITLQVKERDIHTFRNQSPISLPGFHNNPKVLKFIRTNEVTFWLYDDGKAWHC